MSDAEKDWSPETYGRFRGLRLRPAMDLLAQVGDLPEGPVVDLGCGAGAVGPALAARFAGRDLIGVDLSPAMLDRAKATGCYTALHRADLADWQPDDPPALIFSNAALHWLGDHATLMPRLACALTPGGVLAIQMPRQFFAPSHRFLRDIAAAMFPDRFDFAVWEAPVASALHYAEILSPYGAVSVWETSYIQPLDPVTDGHPVRHFTESTAMRPFADKLTPQELQDFVRAYEEALTSAYPLRADGSVLFPFHRIFCVLTCPL